MIEGNPAELQAVEAFLSYPVTDEVWAGLGCAVGIKEGETAGQALHQVGRFVEGRPWFERAVAAKERTEADLPNLDIS